MNILAAIMRRPRRQLRRQNRLFRKNSMVVWLRTRAGIAQCAAIGFISALLLVACTKSYPPLSFPLGKQLPTLKLQNLAGGSVSVATATGKPSIINIWATWCGPCRHELPSLDRLAKLLGPDKVRIFGISVDQDSHVLREYLIERKLGFVNYRDPGRQLADGVLGIHAFPTTLIVGPQGRLLHVVQGWRNWDAPDMVAEVKRYLPPSRDVTP